jgi:hypothetical protein
MISVFPLAFLSFFGHTICHSKLFDDSSTSAIFFEYEAGGTNLAIACALLINYCTQYSAIATCYILIIYAIYLFVAGICHAIFLSIKDSLKFIPLLDAFGYFVLSSGILLQST